MQGVARVGVNDASYEPPEEALQNVLRLAAPSRLKQLSNFLIATFTFDSFSAPATAGVRAAGAASRQMTYEADDLEIALWLRRSENQTVTLTGQISSRMSGAIEDASGKVELVVKGDHIKSSPLSKWGEFLFPDLPQTQYGLYVSLLDRVVLIPLLPMIDEERH
jgi:hypothetical protein